MPVVLERLLVTVCGWRHAKLPQLPISRLLSTDWRKSFVVLVLRPVNLSWAVDRQLKVAAGVSDVSGKVAAVRSAAVEIADEDVAACRSIGEHGLDLFRDISELKGSATVNVLTHCNAGWLAFVDHGSATAPIYRAHDAGIPVHVWVDETRPRNQGARLTAWELGKHGVPHTVITDNAGGHLMRTGPSRLGYYRNGSDHLHG